jgi:hypothetical protein
VLQLGQDPRLGGHPALEHLGHPGRQVVAVARRLEDHGAGEPAVLAGEDLRHAAARHRIGGPAERSLADQALGQIERDRLAEVVVGGDHRPAHRALREVPADPGMQRALQLGEARMRLPADGDLRRIALHGGDLNAHRREHRMKFARAAGGARKRWCPRRERRHRRLRSVP